VKAVGGKGALVSFYLEETLTFLGRVWISESDSYSNLYGELGKEKASHVRSKLRHGKQSLKLGDWVSLPVSRCISATVYGGRSGWLVELSLLSLGGTFHNSGSARELEVVMKHSVQLTANTKQQNGFPPSVDVVVNAYVINCSRSR
jgi:hypothetical protein